MSQPNQRGAARWARLERFGEPNDQSRQSERHQPNQGQTMDQEGVPRGVAGQDFERGEACQAQDHEA
jgi:hypothetical protein